MKSSTYALFIGLGLSVAVAIPVVGGAIAQSGPVPDVEQYDDRDRDMDREGWHRPDGRDDRRYD